MSVDSRFRYRTPVRNAIYIGAYKECDVYWWIDLGKDYGVSIRWGNTILDYENSYRKKSIKALYASIEAKFGKDYSDAIKSLVRLFGPKELVNLENDNDEK